MSSEEEEEVFLGHNKSLVDDKFSALMNVNLQDGNSRRINVISGMLDLFIHLLPCG